MIRRFVGYFVSIFGAFWTIIEAIGFFFEHSWARAIKTWNEGVGFWILLLLSGLFALIAVACREAVERVETANDEVIDDSGILEMMAKERVRLAFRSMKLWKCKWVWNWSPNLEPTDIRGYCAGGDGILKLISRKFRCDYPVEGKIIRRYGEQIAGVNDVGIVCRKEKSAYHNPLRAVFRDVRISGMASRAEINSVIQGELKKVINQERDRRIRWEMKKLRLVSIFHLG